MIKTFGLSTLYPCSQKSNDPFDNDVPLLQVRDMPTIWQNECFDNLGNGFLYSINLPQSAVHVFGALYCQNGTGDTS